MEVEMEWLVDRSNRAEVREWLELLISELAHALEPPSCSAYEVERQRTVVGNNRMLLEISQAALRDAPLGSSTAHVAFLERECRNAEAHLVESEHELERVLE